MASAFNLTAQINLRGPTNLKPIVSQIRKSLGSITSNVDLKIDTRAAKAIDDTTSKLRVMNKVLADARSNAASLSQSFKDLSASIGTIKSSTSAASAGVNSTSQNVQKVAQNINVARTEMEEFGKQSALAIRRFAAFSAVTSIVFALTNAITSGFKAFIDFDRELVKLQQVTGKGATGIKSLQNEITNLATSLGVSSESLMSVASTLAQAGLTADETRTALSALAKTELAPSFDNLKDTTEGAIAAMRQFGLAAGDLEGALGSINAVAAAFAVESRDIIVAIQRTGGVFAAASKGVSEGKDALNEFIAVFTSVRATTRESAETIATGLRTIFTRIQRADTIKQLRQFGVELQDIEGKFVGPFEAVKRLSEALNQLDPRDIRFSTIVEELGGFRQIGKVIPLIQQFQTAQQALGVAQRGSSSLTDAQVKAQQSLANQIAKVREQFLALIRDIGQSTVFNSLFKIVLGLTSGFLSLASAFKPILPILAVFTAIKGVSAIGQFATGFFGGLKKGGGAGGAGKNIGESISGAKEQERTAATARAADAIRENTSALGSLTKAISSLESTIRSNPTKLNSGGKILGFNKGGLVPGNGGGDTVPAYLEGGEVVINRKAVQKYGASNLLRMNKYALGGKAAYIADPQDKSYQSAHFGSDIPFSREQFIAYSSIYKNATFQQSLKEAKAKLGPKATTDQIMQELGIKVKNSIKLSLPKSFNQALKTGDPGLVDQNDLISAINSGENVFKNFTKNTRLNDDTVLRNNITKAIKNINAKKAKNYDRTYDLKKLTQQDLNRSVFDQDNELNSIKSTIINSVSAEEGRRLLDNIDILFKSPEKELQYRQQSRVTAKQSNLFGSGGPIQKFAEGTPGGLRVPKGRGKTGARGARDIIEPISTETYLKWAKGIYDEYESDPSLVWTTDELGMRMPPEIALANRLLAQYAFETGGAGLSMGKKFVVTPSDRITPELKPYLVPNPNNPNELGFFEDQVAKFGRSKTLSTAATAKLGKKEALASAEARISAYTNAESAISEFKKTGSLNIDPSIMSYLKQSIANPDSLPLDKDEIDSLRKKLTKPNLDAFSALAGDKKTPVSVQGQRTKLAEVFNTILETYGSDTSDLEVDNIIKGLGTSIGKKENKATKFSFGGLVQKFIDGSEGGVQPTPILSRTLDQIISQIEELGGPGRVRELLGNSSIEQAISRVSATGQKPRASSILNKPVLRRPETAPFLGTISKLLDEAIIIASSAPEADFKLSEQEIAAAKDVAIVGFQSDLTDLSSYYRKRKGIPLKVHTGVLSKNQYGAVEELWQDYYNAQMKAAERLAPAGSQLTTLSKEDRKKFGIANAQGYDLEVILAALGSGGGKKTTQDAVDFASGLSPLAAGVFGVPAGIPTQAKLTVTSSNITKAIDGIIKTFAVGGLVKGGFVKSALAKSQKTISWGKGPNAPTTTTMDPRATALFSQKTTVDTIEKELSQLGISSLKFIGSGKDSLAYDTGNNVVKFTPSGLKKYSSNISEQLRPSFAKLIEGYGVEVMPKVDTNVTDEDLATLQKIITSKGYQWGDAAKDNMGKLGNRLVVIDGDIEPLKMPAPPMPIKKFAGGGVLAKVSNGEAFVPPKLAKKIGYAKLDKMNQADRNGMSGFADGGISVFKGPGSGTSDSIGPVSLPVGSYIIRKKATDALNLYKHGGSIQYFKDGDKVGKADRGLSKEERKKRKEQFRTQQIGGTSREEAFSAGIVREDFGGAQIDDPLNRVRDKILTARENAAKTQEKAAAKEATAAKIALQAAEDKVAQAEQALKDAKSKKETKAARKQLVVATAELQPAQKRATETSDKLQQARDRVKQAEQDKQTKITTTATSRQKDITATSDPKKLDAIYKKIEQEVLNNYRALYAEEKKKIDDLYNQREADLNDQVAAGTISVGDAFDQSLALNEERKQAKADAKSKLTSDLPQAQAKAVEEFKAGKQTTAVAGRKAEQQKSADAELKAATDQIAKDVTAKYQKLYDEERASLRDFYNERLKQVQAEGGDISEVMAEYKAAVADAKQAMETASKSEIKTQQEAAPAKLQEQKAAQVQSAREDKAREADPFYDVKQAVASSGPVAGMPVVNAKMAQEQKAYTEYKAEKAGMSVSGYKYDLAKRVGKSAFDVRREAEFAKTETKNLAVGKSRELQGVNIKESLKADTQEGRRVQGIIDQFAANLQKVDPSLGAEQARDAAIKLAEGLSEGKQSVEEIIASNKELDATFKKTLSETEIMNEAFRRTGQEIGESAEFVRSNASQKAVQQQQFISSKEGQRFGALAEFAPGLTEKLSKTGVGKALGAGADFISGKGGKFSKAFAGAGGFTGIGTGLAVGAESLKQLLPKSMTSDPNTAGALGALGGAGSGAAMGAQLGSFAGPIGTLIGGVGGAIIGGIQGFFSAKNQAVLTNALEKTAAASGNLTEAFKRLEADSSEVNFKKAQEAAGQLLDAGKDIESIAFANTGYENLGSTFMGGVDKVTQGFNEGDISKIVLGGLQTAFGGSGLGLLTDYFSAPSDAQRTEAIGAMVGGAGQRNEALANLTSVKLKSTSTEELGKIFDAIKSGTGALNPIVEQYKESAIAAAEAANGTKQLTDAQKESISAQAADRAAMDAYMKKRKEAGATDEQIAKEIKKDPAAVKKEGQAALDAQAQLIAKQEMLARATKEVAVATENLLDVYRRVDAYAQRYSSELDQFGADVDSMLAGLGGDTSMRSVNRQNEQVLTNVSAYSMDEVRSAANATAGLLGGTPEAQNLANQSVAQKVITDQIPNLLRNAKDEKGREAAMTQVRSMLEEQGLGGAAIETVLRDLENKITEGVKSGTGTSESDLQDAVQRSFATVGKGAEALANLAKKYNDTLQKAIDLQDKYNRAILEANSYMRKATSVRLNAELDLAKALGRSPTLQELNKPFDVEVQSLTSGLVQTGQLAPGQTSDPMAIADAISAAEKKRDALAKGSPELVAAAAKLPPGAEGDAQRQALNQQQLANIQSMGDLAMASNEGRQALEKLANDGTKAANALAKIQEEQQALEGFANFATSVFTAEPQQLAQMEMQATAFDAAMSAGPEFMQSRFNRQQAQAGLEMQKGFMTPQEYRDAQAELLKKNYQSQGIQGGDVATKIGGKEFTLDQLLERVRGGVSEQDPNVIAFREATETQAKANEALGLLNIEQALVIQDAMLRLEDFFTNKFPGIVTQAQADAQRDSQPRPEAEKPKKEPTATEKELEKAKTERDARKDEEKKAKAEAKKASEAWGWGPGAGRAMEAKAAETKAKDATAARKAADTKVAELEAKTKSEAETRAAEEAEAAKAKAARDAEAKAQKEKENAAEVDATIQRQREGSRPGAPAPVPADDRRARARAIAEANYGGVVRPGVAGAPAAAQATAAAAKPQIDPTTKGLLEREKAGINEALVEDERNKAAKEKELKMKRNTLKFSRMAASAAGTLRSENGEIVNPRVLAAQEAVAMAEADLASANQQIEEKKKRAAEIDKTLSGSQQPPPSPQAQAVAAAAAAPDILRTRSAEDARTSGAPEARPSPQAQAAATAATKPSAETAVASTETQTTATEAVNESVQQLVDPMSLVASMATAALQSGSIYTHDQGLHDAFNALQTPFAAMEQMAMAALSEGINTKDMGLMELATMINSSMQILLGPINNITAILAPILDTIAAPLRGLAGYFGIKLSKEQARGVVGGMATGGVPGAAAGYIGGSILGPNGKPKPPLPEVTPPPNRLDLVTQNAAGRQIPSAPIPGPVPVTAPSTITASPQPQIPAEGKDKVFTLATESIDGLTTFNKNFNEYVEKLINFEFPKIPEKIDVVLTGGNHTVDVRFTGAAALEKLSEDMKKTALALVTPELQKLRDEVSAKTGGAVKNSAAMGQRNTPAGP